MLLLLAGLTARARSIEDIRRIFGAPPPGSISAEYRILLMRVDAYALPRLRSNSTPPKSQPRLRYNEKQVGAHRLATGSTVRQGCLGCKCRREELGDAMQTTLSYLARRSSCIAPNAVRSG
jgi:hypothetical protein